MSEDYIKVKNVKMPSCCGDCWALDDHGDYPVCLITEEQRGYTFRIREKRMDKCPLDKKVNGHWEHITLIDGHAYGECSNCLKLRIVDNFCPNCGADMRELL